LRWVGRVQDPGCRVRNQAAGGWVGAVHADREMQGGHPGTHEGGRRDAGCTAAGRSRGGGAEAVQTGGLCCHGVPAIPPSSRFMFRLSLPWEARSPGPARRRPRTSSGPEGSSDKGITPSAAVPPGSLVRHGRETGFRGLGSGLRTTATFGTPGRDRRGSDRGGTGLNLTTTQRLDLSRALLSGPRTPDPGPRGGGRE